MNQLLPKLRYNCLIFMRIMRWIPALLLSTWLFAAALGQGSETERRLTIFYSGDVQGSFDPCGCAAGPAGGVARRLGYTRQFTQTERGAVIQLDAGNYLSSPGAEAQSINELLFDSMRKLPLRVFNLGSEDLYWWPRLQSLELGETSIIGSNLIPKEGVRGPERFAVVTVPASTIGLENPVRIGFLGLVDPRLIKPNAPFRASDPVAAVRELKDRLLEQCDFIIVLFDTIRPYSRDLPEGSPIRLIAEQNPEVYAVITTEKRYVFYSEIQVNSAVVLSTIERGRHLGRLSLGFDERGNVTTLENGYVEMKEGVPEDGEFESRQQQLRSRIGQ